MSTNFTYLFIDTGAIVVPFIFSFHKKIQFHHQWKALWPAIIITALFFIFWDMIYTYLGVWGFNDRYITSFKIFKLPIEEILFFICIPYASLFTYYCFEKFKLNSFLFSGKLIPYILFTVLLITGIVNYYRIYTSATFITLSLITIYLGSIKKEVWLANFYLMFMVILIPFFIVNGLLTGTGLKEPVVWYNDSENLGLRMLTIPAEDIFYGMLLLLINTCFFEYFRKKIGRKSEAV